MSAFTGRAFAFATDRRLRPWSRAFLIHPEACTVVLTADELTIAFGRWSMSTPTSNIAGAEVTGPYTWWKVAGPAHLSVSDRGVTFATTASRGVCVTFDEPVPAIDPLGVIRHPNVTVTVDRPEELVAAIDEARHGRLGGTPATAPAAPRQGTFRAATAAVLRWNRRGDTIRLERRDVEHIEPPDRQPGPDAFVQTFDDGVGPAFHRRYACTIDGADTDAAGVMRRLQDDVAAAADPRLSPINKVAGDLGSMSEGDRYVVALAGPWSGPVIVTEVDPYRFRFATLEGHLEAGLVDFRTEDLPDGAIRFTIESWARSGDHALRTLYDVLGVAQQLQAEMWTGVCEAVVGIAGGTQRGPVDVLTERAEVA